MIVNSLVGIVIYSLIAVASYSEPIKAHPLYFALGLGLGLIANFCWLHIARGEPNPSKLVLLGLYWDVMLTLTYMLVPMLFFGARLTLMQGLGVLAIFAGIVLTKL